MKKSNFILVLLKIAFWVMYIGLGISTIMYGVFFLLKIYSYISGEVLFSNFSMIPFKIIFQNMDQLGKGAPIIILLTSIFYALEANLILTVIRVLDKVNLKNPFSVEVYRLISKISTLSLILGIFSIGVGIIAELVKNKIAITSTIGDEDYNFLVFAGIIYIIGIIYKRGVDLQSENELTI